MAKFALGGSDREHVEVEVLDYERAQVGEYHDDNWLRVRVSISAGAFSGAYDAAFLTDELVSFRDQLEALYGSLKGEAQFSTLEEQLQLKLTGNGRGEITARCAAVDVPGKGSRLEFALLLDQTHVHRTLAQLSDVILQFPVRAG